MHQVMPDQQMPEAIRTLIQVRHRQIRSNCAPILWPPPPDGSMREKALINPSITLLEFFRYHVLWTKHRMRRVVPAPIAVQQASRCLHLLEERCPRVGRE